MKTCPNCAQMIETTDFKCPYCQKTLPRPDKNFRKFRRFITLIFAFIGALFGSLCGLKGYFIGAISGLAVGYLYGVAAFTIRSQNFLIRILVGTVYGILAGIISGAWTGTIGHPLGLFCGGYVGAIPGFFLGIIFSTRIAFIRKSCGQEEQNLVVSKKTDLIAILIQIAFFASFIIQHIIYSEHNPQDKLKSSSDDIGDQYSANNYAQEVTVQPFDKPTVEKFLPKQEAHEQAANYKTYIKNGEYEKAIDSISRFLNLRSNSPYLRKTLLIQRGDLFMVTEKYQEALSDYTESLEIIRRLQNGNVSKNQSYIDEGSSLCLLKRGVAYRRLGLFDQAITDLSTAIAEKPSERILKDCYLQRGLAYKAINNIEKFKNDFKELTNLGKNLVEGFFILDNSRWLEYGKFIWYYEDGTPKVECNYQNAEVVGTCKYFNPDGSVK